MSIKNLPADYLLATQQGDIDKVETCLAPGVDINTCDRQGKMVITLTSLYQQYACVQVLIDAGADINKRDHICSNPFLISCLNDDLMLLRITLPARSDPNCVTRFGGVDLTPACEKSHLGIVKELLAHTEININQTNHVGWMSLLEAVVFNDGGIKQQAIVQLLPEHGTNPHPTDKCGRMPLELVRERGFEEVTQLLIAAGAQTGKLAINIPEKRCVWVLTADADFPVQRRQGQAEQVFARMVNIALLARQRLLALFCEEYDNASSSCRLALTHFDDLFRHGDKVQLDDQGITVG